MKDAVEREIRVGDIVVKAQYGGYANIHLYRVERFTPKQVRLTPVSNSFVADDRAIGQSLSAPSCLLVINEVVEAVTGIKMQNNPAPSKVLETSSDVLWED